ncbi:hypothetical protein Tco_0273019 [Tanacetum coccineum]
MKLSRRSSTKRKVRVPAKFKNHVVDQSIQKRVNNMEKDDNEEIRDSNDERSKGVFGDRLKDADGTNLGVLDNSVECKKLQNNPNVSNLVNNVTIQEDSISVHTVDSCNDSDDDEEIVNNNATTETYMGKIKCDSRVCGYGKVNESNKQKIDDNGANNLCKQNHGDEVQKVTNASMCVQVNVQASPVKTCMDNCEDNKNNSSYVDTIRTNKYSDDNKLDHIPTVINEDGIEYVVFDDELVKEGSRRWELSACGYFVGYKMSIHELRIGTPLIMDAMTTSMCKNGFGRIGYARVLVEVNAKKGIVDSIDVLYMNKENSEKHVKK